MRESRSHLLEVIKLAFLSKLERIFLWKLQKARISSDECLPSLPAGVFSHIHRRAVTHDASFRRRDTHRKVESNR